MHVLLNWLVQGTAVTIVVGLSVRACRSMTAATRERIWWMTIVGVTLMPVAFLLADLAAASSTPLLPSAARPDPLLMVNASWNRWAIATAMVWAVWTIRHLGRIGLDLIRLERAKRSADPFPRMREERLPLWVGMRGRARPATLVASTRVHCAAVLGLRRPLIAVAPDALDRLTDEELDQIVLHEYAHVQRRDDLAMVAQRIISAIAGLHPAVWWLDRALTIDREIACDDWVVTYAGARSRYAQCLLSLASSAGTRGWHLVPGALFSRSHLAIRIAALLDGRRAVAIGPSRAAFLIALPAVLVLVLASVSMPLVGVAGERLTLTPAFGIVAIGADASIAHVLPTSESSPTAVRRIEPAPRDPRLLQERPPSMRSRPLPTTMALQIPIDVPSELLEAPLPSTSFTQVDLIAAPSRPSGRTIADAGHGTPWKAAADAGLAIGSGSRFAALRAAAAFSRVGTSFANSF